MFLFLSSVLLSGKFPSMLVDFKISQTKRIEKPQSSSRHVFLLLNFCKMVVGIEINILDILEIILFPCHVSTILGHFSKLLSHDCYHKLTN